MSWTTPRTWVTSEVVSSSLLNTHVRDNLTVLRGYVAVRMSAAQNHSSSGSYATMNWDAEDYDTDGYHDNSTNNSRLTVPTGGAAAYLMFASVQFSAQTNRIGLKFRKNGSDLYGASTVGGAGQQAFHLSDVVVLADADYVEVQCIQSNGTQAYTVGSSGEACRFGMHKIG